jgi:PAS domain S-box-containing protein
MGERQAGWPPVAMRSFVAEVGAEVLATWKKAIGGPELTLQDQLPELLERIADLAEQVVAGEPLERTFERARGELPQSFGESCDVPRVIAELAVLRGCIVEQWQRARPVDGEGELRALDVAIDAVIAAAVTRCQESAGARAEVLAAQRERVLGKLESLLAASPVGIAFLDSDLRYLRINEAMAALDGRPVAGHLGRSLGEVMPDAAPLLEPMLRQVMATGQPVLNRELTRALQSDPAERRFLLATFFPVRAPSGGIVGVGVVVSDVTEARRAEEDLRREQARMQAILEHTPAPIWIKDAEGRIVLANHRLADALGVPFEELIGRRSEDLLPAEFAADHRAHDELVRRERHAIEREESIPAPDGIRTFLSLKFPLPGDPPMVGAIATDISERKRSEDELRAAVRARDAVLAVVSHDLRNPLGTIQLSTATLLIHLAGDPHRRQLEIIQRSCLRMEHLIEDLLDMSSIAAGRLSIATRPELADDLVREAAELHHSLADERGIDLVRGGAADGVSVECDRQRVMQVFANLIGNALKFCRAGDRVSLGCERADDGVRFWVEDTGPGIRPELLAQIFDRYWSAPGTRSGAGLGLYIAHGIVERHGGRIEVASTFGSGTRFSFTLPPAATAA